MLDLSTPEVLLDITVFALGALYASLAPYTKVEESFNLHATHDVIFHGVSNITQVSRTFALLKEEKEVN